MSLHARRFALALVLPACALLAVVLGFWGFVAFQCPGPTAGSVPPPADPLWLRAFAAGLRTVQLFYVGVGAENLCAWQTRSAAVLAPVAGIGTALALLWRGARRRLRWIGLRWEPATAIFLGGGTTAASIAVRLYGAGREERKAQLASKKIVGLDIQADKPLAKAVSTLGGTAFEWRGDALSDDVVRDLNALRAKQIWVLTGDDLRNVEIARRLLELRGSAAGTDVRRPWLFANVHDQRILRAQTSLYATPAYGLLHFFSMPRIAARQLLLKCSPVIPRVTRTGLAEDLLHIAVVGDGDLAEAIAEHAIAHLVYSDNRAYCVRVTLVGPHAVAMRSRLYQRLPALDPRNASQSGFESLLPLARINAWDCETTEWMPGDWQRLQRDAPFSAVYVTHDIDLATMAAALRAAALRDAGRRTAPQRVVACLKQGTHEHGALEKHAVAESSAKAPEMLPEQFHIYDDSLDPDEPYPGAKVDLRAMLVNLVYHTEGSLDERDTKATLADAHDLWFGAKNGEIESTPEDFRWSSRLVADHIEIKRACLGLREGKWLSQTAASGLQANPEQDTQWLMRLEHRRFVVERLLNGWLPIDDSSSIDHEAQQKRWLRLNRTLVPFTKLSSLRPYIDAKGNARQQEEKDRRIVEATPAIVRIAAELSRNMHDANASVETELDASSDRGSRPPHEGTDGHT